MKGLGLAALVLLAGTAVVAQDQGSFRFKSGVELINVIRRRVARVADQLELTLLDFAQLLHLERAPFQHRLDREAE